MKVDFAFGKSGLSINLPDRFQYCLLEARSAAPLPDWASALETALDHPTGTAPLQELTRGKQSASISVCDITRPAPNQLVLPAVLKRLHAGGIPKEEVLLLIATGLHRPATNSEIREILGEEISSSYWW